MVEVREECLTYDGTTNVMARLHAIEFRRLLLWSRFSTQRLGHTGTESVRQSGKPGRMTINQSTKLVVVRNISRKIAGIPKMIRQYVTEGKGDTAKIDEAEGDDKTQVGHICLEKYNHTGRKLE